MRYAPWRDGLSAVRHHVLQSRLRHAVVLIHDVMSVLLQSDSRGALPTVSFLKESWLSLDKINVCDVSVALMAGTCRQPAVLYNANTARKARFALQPSLPSSLLYNISIFHLDLFCAMSAPTQSRTVLNIPRSIIHIAFGKKSGSSPTSIARVMCRRLSARVCTDAWRQRVVGEIDMAQAMNLNVGSANETLSFCNIQVQAYNYNDQSNVGVLSPTIICVEMLTPHQRARLLRVFEPIKTLTALRLNDLAV